MHFGFQSAKSGTGMFGLGTEMEEVEEDGSTVTETLQVHHTRYLYRVIAELGVEFVCVHMLARSLPLNVLLAAMSSV